MSPVIQPKLLLGAQNDLLEHEADKIADRIMSISESASAAPAEAVTATTGHPIQRACSACGVDEEKIQRQVSDKQHFVQWASGKVPPEVTRVGGSPRPQRLLLGLQRKCAQCDEAGEEQVQRTPRDGHSGGVNSNEPTHVPDILAGRIAAERLQGRRLAASVRRFFESRTGHDFSRVRVHDDGAASSLNQALGARAFTVGRDIFFRQGEFQPERREGRRLLAHELAHTIQQGAARMPSGRGAEDDASGRSWIQRAPAAEDEITAADQALLDAQRAAEEREARLIEPGLELKQGQLDLRRIKSDKPCSAEKKLNVKVSRVPGSLVSTGEMKSFESVNEDILSMAGNAEASISLIGPSATARIIQTEAPLDWSLRWFCPEERTTGFTIDAGGTSGTAFSSASGTSGIETASHEISTDSIKGGGMLVERGKSKVLQDVHKYGFDTSHARALYKRAQDRGFDDRRCGYVLEQRFNATVGTLNQDEKLMSRCYYSFVYRAERDTLTGDITVSVQYKGADVVDGDFKESRRGGASSSSQDGQR